MNRYILYARKSQEDEGRQQQSIEDQIQVMTAAAAQADLVVTKVLTERRSAKEPYERPVFDSMLAAIQSGEVDSILCYNVNRLARNMVEGGLLQHLLTKGDIKEIKTHSEVFRSGDNILPFVLQTAMSTQYSLDLVKVVKRGLNSRAAKGDFPGRAPEGYRNDRNSKSVLIDEDRFPLMQRAWKLMLTGTYSLDRLAATMNDWGYRTRPTLRTGSRPMTRPSLHQILHNVFYTGRFLYNGDIYTGNHPPMVTMDEFKQVQRILSRGGQTRLRSYEFAFTGMIVCSRCGHMVTAELKRGKLKRGHYIYYHCANTRHCRPKPVREEYVEDLINKLLQAIEIDPKFEELATEVIKRQSDDEDAALHDEVSKLESALADAETRRSRLIKLVMDGLITNGEFTAEKVEVQRAIVRIHTDLVLAQQRLTTARNGLSQVAQYAASAPYTFLHASVAVRREIARKLCRTYYLNNGNLTAELHPLLKPLLRASLEPPKSANSICYSPEESDSVRSRRDRQTVLEAFRQVWKLLLQGTEPLHWDNNSRKE